MAPSEASGIDSVGIKLLKQKRETPNFFEIQNDYNTKQTASNPIASQLPYHDWKAGPSEANLAERHPHGGSRALLKRRPRRNVEDCRAGRPEREMRAWVRAGPAAGRKSLGAGAGDAASQKENSGEQGGAGLASRPAPRLAQPPTAHTSESPQNGNAHVPSLRRGLSRPRRRLRGLLAPAAAGATRLGHPHSAKPRNGYPSRGARRPERSSGQTAAVPRGTHGSAAGGIAQSVQYRTLAARRGRGAGGGRGCGGLDAAREWQQYLQDCNEWARER